ncbi:MAG: hypothetical protein QOH61_1966, partial [Chloroflexota bacterium]|nr:hypothetical protein [Chloroflexota bacterium]
MGLAGLSQYLFVAGAICLVLGFLLHVAHTTILAADRRQVGALALGRGLAGATGTATITVSGPGPARPSASTSAGSSAASALGGPLTYRSSTTAGSIGIALTWTAAILVALSMLVRAWIVGRGPWGNMYEFSVAFALGIVGGYLFLQRRYPIRTIGFLPLGVA